MSSQSRTCPSCQAKMKPFQAGKIELDRCTFCRGLWFDGGELEGVLGKPAAPKIVEGRTSRKCAKCQIALAPGELGGLQVEACTTCHGVFLDEGELKKLNAGQQIRIQQGAAAPPPEAKVKDDVMDWLNSMVV